MSSLIFIVAYYIAWLLYFQLLQRPLFLIYNHKLSTSPVKPGAALRIARYGLKTDVIACSYLTALPLLLTIAQAYIPYPFLGSVMSGYNILISFIVVLASLSDTALYTFWQHKIDSSVLAYLKTLKWAVASVSTTYLITAILLLLIAWAIVYSWLSAITSLTLTDGPFTTAGSGWLPAISTLLIGLALIATLFIFIRGLHGRPNNPSLSFFSPVQFFNHAALNPFYSFIYSLSVNEKIEGMFRFMEQEECDNTFKPLFPTASLNTEKLLKTARPNVLFIIWESFSARFVESLGGTPGVTPNIDRLSKEGLYFTQSYSSSFRTDRGLVALLSGYLAQPTMSIIRNSAKLPNLPAFPRRFKELGYETTAVHGGDLMVFHMSEYFLTMGHDRIVSEPDMPSSMSRGKWGVPDGEMMDWLYDDIMDKESRGVQWYTTFLTLSSHEPWQVPYNRLPDDPTGNAFAYVDDAFGRLVERLKQTPAWDNLLIIVTGDHGCNTGCTPLSHEEYPHIPLLLLGGAVKEPRQIDAVVSQTDIAATVLAQMGLNHDEFTFSRDVFSSTYTPTAFNTFVNGFVLRDTEGATVVDNITDKAIKNPNPEREHKGRAILQYLYADIAKR